MPQRRALLVVRQGEHVTRDLRHKLHSLIDEIVDAIEGSATTEWVDAKTSPLGRERHNRLVREGKLRGTKDGRRVLVRRADIDAYLEKNRVIRVDEKADIDREAARILATMQRKAS
jgi:excisionase family DNA binding protein